MSKEAKIIIEQVKRGELPNLPPPSDEDTFGLWGYKSPVRPALVDQLRDSFEEGLENK